MANNSSVIRKKCIHRGADIITEMTMSGELDQLFAEKNVSFSQEAAAKIREENS